MLYSEKKSVDVFYRGKLIVSITFENNEIKLNDTFHFVFKSDVFPSLAGSI